MFLMREELNHSFPNIGDELGGRDHTTIMHGYTKIREQLKSNERLESDLTTIREQLYQELE
jgi:chromosomal replication initiator protein